MANICLVSIVLQLTINTTESTMLPSVYTTHHLRLSTSLERLRVRAMVRQQRRKMVAVMPPTTTLSLELCLVGLPVLLTPLVLVMVTRLAAGPGII